MQLSQRQCGRPDADESRTACEGGRSPCNRPLKFQNFKIVGCGDFVIAPFKLQEQTVVCLLYIYIKDTQQNPRRASAVSTRSFFAKAYVD